MGPQGCLSFDKSAVKALHGHLLRAVPIVMKTPIFAAHTVHADLRDVTESAAHVLADVLDVAPLLSLYSRQHVVHRQLSLVEQVLDDEHGRCQQRTGAG